MRILNRLLGALFWLALAVGCVLAAVECVLALLDRPGWLVDRPQLGRDVTALAWDDTGVVAVAVVVLVVGLVLVVAQLVPRRPTHYRTDTGGEHRTVRLERRGVEQRLQRAAVDDNDVVGARARARRRRVRVRAHALGDRREVRERVQQRVAEAIEQLHLDPAPRAKVDVRPAGSRTR